MVCEQCDRMRELLLEGGEQLKRARALVLKQRDEIQELWSEKFALRARIEELEREIQEFAQDCQKRVCSRCFREDSLESDGCDSD